MLECLVHSKVLFCSNEIVAFVFYLIVPFVIVSVLTKIDAAVWTNSFGSFIYSIRNPSTFPQQIFFDKILHIHYTHSISFLRNWENICFVFIKTEWNCLNRFCRLCTKYSHVIVISCGFCKRKLPKMQRR